jgi:hypothetical protein
MGMREKLRAALGRDPTREEVQEAKRLKRNGEELSHSRIAGKLKREWSELQVQEVEPQVQEDWTCANCNASCFGRNASCFKCGASKDGSSPGSKRHRRREGTYKPPPSAVASCQDKTLTCKVCSADFIFTAGEQEYFLRKGFIGVERARCTDCAKVKKRKLPAEPVEKPTSGGRLVCFDWQTGRCTRGESCRFAHAEPDGVLTPVRRAAERSDEEPSPPKVQPALKCFHCNMEGHRVADCPKVKAQQARAAAKAAAAPKKKKRRNRNGTLPTANQMPNPNPTK